MEFIETSAKTKLNVEECFMKPISKKANENTKVTNFYEFSKMFIVFSLGCNY